MNKNIEEIYNFLVKKFPNASCELKFRNLYELFVSVILSAQCTDKRVNMVTKNLFEKYPDFESISKINLEELEKYIMPCGLYHNKAKNIINASKIIVEKYKGIIPEDFDRLIKLPGVGRKTANVIISAGFGKDAIAVDTHVHRVANRLNLSKEKNPEKVEKDLQKIIDKKFWTNFHYLFVLFGRYICKAKKPLCNNCLLKEKCVYYKKNKRI